LLLIKGTTRSHGIIVALNNKVSWHHCSFKQQGLMTSL